MLWVARTALECRCVDEMQRAVLCLLEKILKSDKLVFFLTGNSGKGVNFKRCLTRGADERLFNQYCDYYWKIDPCFEYYSSLNCLTFRPKQIIPFKILLSTEYYNDFAKKLDSYHSLCILLRTGGRPLGHIGLSRSRRETDFSVEEQTKAEMMAPYLAAALERNIILENIQKQECILNTTITDLPNKGIILLDESLEIVYMNENAVNILSKFPLVEGHRERQWSLPSEIYQICQKTKKSISPNENLETYQQKFHLVIRGSEEKILCKMRLIYPANNLPLFLVSLESDEALLLYSPSLKEKLHLNPREVDIINLIYQGLKNTEISEKLFISEHTVKNHIYNIFEKIGIKNRTSLLQWVIQKTKSIQ